MMRLSPYQYDANMQFIVKEIIYGPTAAKFVW